MKKFLIFLLAVLAWSTTQAEENNTFYFTDAAVLPGDTTSIELCMKNATTDLTCFEAEILLPEGLSLVRDEEGNPVSTLYRNRGMKHEITTNVLENGNLKLLVSSIEGSLFNGGDGPLLSFLVQADKAASRGECVVETVGESLLVNSEAEAYYSIGVTGSVLITDDATGLNSAFYHGEQDKYNLAGQRVSNKQKGIVIVKGRKELHK